MPSRAHTRGRKPGQRYLAPEVVQTSHMDCGPAALKCLVDGFGRPVSYERLREACQTDLDGASIDVMETLANQLGVVAEQSLIPLDQAFSRRAALLPAMVVMRRPDGSHHFVVAWSRVAGWLQVMDPAAGRRWVREETLAADVHVHQTSVDAGDWCSWARSEGFLALIRGALKDATGSDLVVQIVTDQALAAPRWFGLAALDAVLRLVGQLLRSGGIVRGRAAEDLIVALFDDVLAREDDLFAVVPRAYWSVVPDLNTLDPSRERLIVSGAVLLHVSGCHSAAADPVRGAAERVVNLRAPTQHPVAMLWTLLGEDGLFAPAALGGAMVLAAGAVILQLVLFRALLDVSQVLQLGAQRLAGLVLLAIVVNLIMMVEIPIIMETQRLGRRLELRLRMAVADKLPRLHDRFFQSRPVSDMAERSHSLHSSRLAPGLAVHLVQALFSLLFTLGTISWLATDCLVPGLALALAAVALPLAAQPLLGERDLTVRTHLAALTTLLLDALIGIAPIRTHQAQRTMRALHEGLVTQWARAGRRLIGLSSGLALAQSVICTGLAAATLWRHFVTAGVLSGGDLLLVYWVLRLPAIGGELSRLVMQYPAQRNVLARMMEPLAAPDAETVVPEGLGVLAPTWMAAPRREATTLTLDRVTVMAGGRPILRDIDLTLRPGEHVAIVGPSGAGKSSLLGVLMGWATPSEGAVFADGESLRGQRLEDLRRATAWVDPSVRLWNRSFLDNLGYAAGDIDPGRLDSVLRTSQLRGMLHKLPSGLQSLLGEGGGCLSGGEGQRVRLGRALLQKDVRLVLLDEPFRGLDRTQRTRLMRETRAWWPAATLLCVSHDLSETLGFDRVVVVDGGRIVEDGHPGQLSRAGGRYQALLEAERQAGEALWADGAWRRIVMREGVIVSDDRSPVPGNITALEGRYVPPGRLKFLRSTDPEWQNHGA